jgi:hypothetical protein
MVDGKGKVGLSVSTSIFGNKSGEIGCKSVIALTAGANSQIPLVYVRYKDHVVYKNIENPKAEAVERETAGWLTKQDDEIILIENDRSLRVKGASGVNGVVLLKSCIMEIQVLPLQKMSKWALNSQQIETNGEYALQPKRRKTQNKTTTKGTNT